MIYNEELLWVVTSLIGGACIGWFSRGRQVIAEKAIASEREKAFLTVENTLHITQQRLLEVSQEKAALDARASLEKEKMVLAFESLSHKLLQENSEEFSKQSKQQIESVLSPLKQKIDLFQMQVAEIAKAGTVERLSLKNTIGHIAETSKDLAEETKRLKQALKGDIKKQGAWGELVLQRVLEASGLRKEEEYIIQATGLSLSNEQGGRMQPDVIIQLPHTRHVIIDAKMPYTHYDAYYQAETEEAKADSVKKLILAVREHIRGLSEKHYSLLQELQTPHFVLLFVPIEAIFSLVLEADPHLFEEAWKRSVILVSPANLLAILRTIESLWKIEKQSVNTQKIAEEGAALYDKFVDFLKDLENVGKNLQTTQEHLDKAVSKLSTGRGNLIKKVENLRLLGLKTKKQISSENLEDSFIEESPSLQ